MFRLALFIIGIVTAFSFLSSCATLSKSECKVGDWYAIGKADGQEGRLLERFEKHKEACAAYKSKIKKSDYVKGRTEGLKTYCNLQHQINLGIKGIRYKPVCSGKIVALLKEANDAGYRAYSIKNDLDSTSDQIRDVRSRLDAKDLKAAERERLREEESRLEDQVERLKNELKRLSTEGAKELTRKAKAFYHRS